MIMVESLPLALPETSHGAAAQLLLPRRRAGARALPAVVICPDLNDMPGGTGEAASSSCAVWLGRGLAASGVAVTLPATSAASGAARVDERLGAIMATIAQLRRTTAIDRARIGVLGIGSGAALACRVAAEDDIDRVALVGPVAAELVVRRLDRFADRGAERGKPAPNESVDAALMRRLAALQPLRTLAQARPKPTIVVHAASDEQDGPEHAQAIAMAVSLDGRPVERFAIAFIDAGFAAEDDPAVQHAVLAPLAGFFAAR